MSLQDIISKAWEGIDPEKEIDKTLSTFSNDDKKLTSKKGHILNDFITFVDKENEIIKYIKPTFVKPIDEESSDDDDDFLGDSIGEVSLKLQKTTLDDGEIIHYENNDDLLKKVVNFIWNSTNNYVATDDKGPLAFDVDKASDFIFSRYARGGVTYLFCNKNFYIKRIAMGNERSCGFEGTVLVDFLPDNIAITVFKDGPSPTIAAYLNKKEKYIRIKVLADYASVIFEE